MSRLKKPVPFGKYYLLERINVGGMAEVFKAKTFGVEGFERLLAVKRILPNIAEDEEFISMFIDEAKIAVQLQHANIAQIFDLGKVDGQLLHRAGVRCTAGTCVRSSIACASRGESMPVSMACYVMMQVCEGLDYAHNKRDAPGAPAAPHSPRHLAPERPHRLRGRGQADRLRHRQGGRQGVDHPGRHPEGQVRLHVARAGARAADRQAQRHLRGRHRALRVADRRAAVRRRDRLLDVGEGPQRRDRSALFVQQEDPARAGAASS